MRKPSQPRWPRRAHARGPDAVSQPSRGYCVFTSLHESSRAGETVRAEGQRGGGEGVEGVGHVQERSSRDAHAQQQTAAGAELGDGGGAKSVSTTREPPARAQCDPDPTRPLAHHGQRGQPGGWRWRRAAAARRLWPRPWPRCREAAFSTSRRRTAPRGERGADDGGSTGP